MSKRNIARREVLYQQRQRQSVEKSLTIKLEKEIGAQFKKDSYNDINKLQEAHRLKITKILFDTYVVIGPSAIRLANRHRKSLPAFFSTFMLRFARSRSMAMGESISSTTYKRIAKVIADALISGENEEQTKDKIVAYGLAHTEARAKTIARTETHAAQQKIQIESVKELDNELGVTSKKRWLPSEDERTRPTHDAMLDHPAIPLTQKFQVGDSYLDYPGDINGPPEETINCRCVLIYE